MPARRLGRLVGSLLLLAVLAIGSYAAGAGGFFEPGQPAAAEAGATDMAAATSAGQRLYMTNDFSWT